MSHAGGGVEAEGTVVEVHGIKATVLLHATGERVRCRPHRSRQLLAVGDRVVTETGRHGTHIATIGPRDHVLWRRSPRGQRPMASHVDRLLAIAAVAPPIRPGLIDRFLVAAELAGIPAAVVLNKVDLPGADEAREAAATYRELGYPVLEASAKDGTGVPALAELVAEGISVLAGHSGVGKSSLLNALVPDLSLLTATISEATGKGRHTTSVATCHVVGGRWPGGGLVVDTPGVRAFGLHGLPLSDLAVGFRELRDVADRCHFRNCLHEEEPGCAVRAAAGEGAIEASRYTGYRRLLDSVRAGDG